MIHTGGWRGRSTMAGLMGVLGVSLVLFAAAFAIAPARAQDDVASLEDLKAEREAALEAAAATAELIDVETATVEELSAALDELNRVVMMQEAKLEDAKRVVESAEAAVESADERRREVVSETEVVRRRIADLALTSFTGEGSMNGDDMTELAMSDDPGEAARIQHLVHVQTGSLSDNLDRMRALEVEAQLLIAEEEIAAASVEASLEVVTQRSADLETTRDRQAILVVAAETQLEARLAEAAFLEERDFQLATEIRDQQEAINRRVATAARAQGVEIPPPVDLEDIVLVTFEDLAIDFKIEVHTDIAEETEALFRDAFATGLDLAGWGYRPIQLQIDLRAAHCGGTDFDIWHKPVFECAPPTARPGFSKHEQGRAVDFTSGGTSVRDVNGAIFRWLSSNAPRYGFVNLEGEPWHWSIDE